MKSDGRDHSHGDCTDVYTNPGKGSSALDKGGLEVQDQGTRKFSYQWNLLQECRSKSAPDRCWSTCPRAWWISMLLLEWLWKQCNHPAQVRTAFRMRCIVPRSNESYVATGHQ